MRSVRRLAVVLVIAAVLLGGADVASRAVAQSMMADRLRAGQQLAATPEVSVAGFPFLTQALRGRYDEIVVTSPSTTAAATGTGTPTLQHLEAHLRGVHAPLSLLTGSSSAVQVESVTASATVSYAQLAAALMARIPQLTRVQLSDGAGDKVTLRAAVTAYGITVPVDAAATVTVAGDRLTVRVDPSALADQPAAVRTSLTKLLTVTLTLPRLPYRLTVSQVRPTTDGIAVTARAGATALQLH